MKFLVTGSAGFIGMHLSKRLLDKGFSVVGIDNINNYYDIKLKLARLDLLKGYKNFKFQKIDISNKVELLEVFESNSFDVVFNLAAQAGVRYSISNPDVYIDSNIIGFFNVIEACRMNGIKKLVYASSSSVYGNSEANIFSENEIVDRPISLYAATKKANELIAHTYSHLFDFQTIGLRFFTVYGPWGRPDMAYYKFLNSLNSSSPIEVYNNGNLYRDFTYIDDVIDGILSTIKFHETKYEIFNLGNNKPILLSKFISVIEEKYGKSFEKIYVKMQDGDVTRTSADITKAKEKLEYNPKTDIEDGITSFIKWYKEFHKC